MTIFIPQKSHGRNQKPFGCARVNMNHPALQDMGGGDLFVHDRLHDYGLIAGIKTTPVSTATRIGQNRVGLHLHTPTPSQSGGVSTPTNLGGETALTLAAVINCSSPTTTSNQNTQMRWSTSSSRGAALSLFRVSDTVFKCRGLIQTSGTTIWTVDQDYTLPASYVGADIVLAMTWDGSNRRLYAGLLGQEVSLLRADACTGSIDNQPGAVFRLHGGVPSNNYGEGRQYLTLFKTENTPHSALNALSTNIGSLFKPRRQYWTFEHVVYATTWTSATGLSTARWLLAGCGTQTAALAVGGLDALQAALGTTEEYNGTSWSAGGTLATVREDAAACGTQSAALVCAGDSIPILDSSEEYNGTSWSAGGTLTTARYSHAMCGTQTAALAAAGISTGRLVSTEEYNGTTWSAGGSLTTARDGVSASGTQSAAIIAGGYAGSTIGTLDSSEEYNGTSWSAGGDLIKVRSSNAAAGGLSTGLSFGGLNDSAQPDMSSTERYDGSTWTFGDSMITARGFLAGAGAQDLALSFGGLYDIATGNTDPMVNTEEYGQPVVSSDIFRAMQRMDRGFGAARSAGLGGILQ